MILLQTMPILRYGLLAGFLALCGMLSAQDAHSDGHETFALDSVELIELRLYDDYDTIFWSGNRMMIQTTVDLYGCREHILDFFHEQERYAVRDTVIAGQLIVSSVDTERKLALVKGKECYEQVTMRVFIPESFAADGPHRFRRKED
jgi:hypothetical protein